MRGGSIPLLIWATILALVLGTNWVWTSDRIQIATFAFAVVSTVVWALAFLLLRPREALRRGAPPPDPTPRAVPSASYGTALLAVGAASLVFGFVFGHFFIYFGIGLMVVALGAIGRELVMQRRARDAARRGGGS